eukprot:801637-Rhodomonas_salina.3
MSADELNKLIEEQQKINNNSAMEYTGSIWEIIFSFQSFWETFRDFRVIGVLSSSCSAFRKTVSYMDIAWLTIAKNGHEMTKTLLSEIVRLDAGECDIWKSFTMTVWKRDSMTYEQVTNPTRWIDKVIETAIFRHGSVKSFCAKREFIRKRREILHIPKPRRWSE